MITEKDLEEAIAECQGQRNPNASTCIKLAAFYTIKKELFGGESKPESGYSYAPSPQAVNDTISFASDTEFSDAIRGQNPDDVWQIIDELMTALSVVNPRLYDATIRKLNNL